MRLLPILRVAISLTEGNQAAVQIGNDADGGAEKEATVVTSGGQYSSSLSCDRLSGRLIRLGNLTITAGYFTSDPSGYLAEGKAAVESDKAGYNYMVAESYHNAGRSGARRPGGQCESCFDRGG